MSRLRHAVAALALVGGTILAAAPGATADPPKKEAWEAQVERETAEQSALIDEARRRKAMDVVVRRYASAVSRDPSVLNRYLLGRALFWNEDVVGARRQMELVLQENAAFYPARVRLALLLADLKDFDGAEREARAVLATRPEQTEAREVLLKLAITRKDWARALALLNERLDREPGDQRVRSLLAQVHLERKDVESALRETRLLLGREPQSPEYRLLYGVCLLQKGDVDAAIAVLDPLSRERAGDLDVLDRLRVAYLRKKDWARLLTTLQRMQPHLPADRQADVAAMIAELQKGPPSATPPGGREPDAPARIDWAAVSAVAKGADRDRREQALRALYEGTQLDLVARLEGDLLRRIDPHVEPDPGCRAWAVRLHGTINPPELPLLQIALYDPDPRVRMLAAETMGDLGRPLAVVYLLPLLEVDVADVVEYQALRDALARLTGFVDLPVGTTAVTTAADVAASREAWRRWSLSDESRDVKLRAVAELLAAGTREPTPERYLFRFALDPDFDVMKPAYQAMRDVVGRGGTTPLEKRVFPRFPTRGDADVTRATMRALQDEVRRWWDFWVAERRTELQAKGAR